MRSTHPFHSAATRLLALVLGLAGSACHRDEPPNPTTPPPVERPATDDALDEPRAFAPADERQQELYDTAIALLREGHEDRAMTALLALADRTEPHSELRASGVLLLSELYHQQGDTEQALHWLESLRATTPPNAQLEYVIGRTWMDNGQFVEAEDALRRAVRRDPEHVRAYLALGAMLESNGRVADAAEVMLAFEREVYRMGDELADDSTTTERRAQIVERLARGVPDVRLSRALLPGLAPRSGVRSETLRALRDVGTVDALESLQQIADNADDPLAGDAAAVYAHIVSQTTEPAP